MFLSQIPVHTAVPNNPPPPSLSPASIRTVEREYQPSLPPSSESSSSSSSREGIGERSKGVVQEWTPEGGGCRLSYCRDRFESRFHAALAEIIQSGRNARLSRNWKLLERRNETSGPSDPLSEIHRQNEIRISRRGGVTGLDSPLSSRFELLFSFSSVFDPWNGIFSGCLDFYFDVLVRGDRCTFPWKWIIIFPHLFLMLNYAQWSSDVETKDRDCEILWKNSQIDSFWLFKKQNYLKFGKVVKCPIFFFFFCFSNHFLILE